MAAAVTGKRPESPAKKFHKSGSLPAIAIDAPRGALKKSTLGTSKSATSLPQALPAAHSSPFDWCQPLVQVEVGKKRFIRMELGGPKGDKKSQVKKDLSWSRLGGISFERGLEYEQPHMMPVLPPEKLPSVKAIIGMALNEFCLGTIIETVSKEQGKKKRTKMSAKEKCQRGYEAYLGGPRLPVKQEWREVTKKVVEKSEKANYNHLRNQQEEDSDDETPKEEYEWPDLDALDSVADDDLQIDQVMEDAKEEDPPFPWTEQELQTAFYKYDLDKDGEIHKEELLLVMQYLGQRPALEVLQDLASKISLFATLNWDEFNDFVLKYREYDITQLRLLFKEADVDKGGTLDIQELYALLKKQGYRMNKGVVIEAMEFCDKSGSGSLNFRDFEGLREYLRQYEGFLKDDVTELKALYDKAFKKVNYSPLGSEEAIVMESWRISTYLGFSATQAQVHQIVNKVDADNSGKLSFQELLKIIRIVREDEAVRMETIVREKFNQDVVPIEDLGIMLSELGYFVADDAVWEILDNLGDTEKEDSLTMEELTLFLLKYRAVEGFTQKELQDMTEAFRLEQDAEESLGAPEVGRMLRWFGFSRTIQEVSAMVCEVDFDESGRVEFNEFVKLMRRLHHAEAIRRNEVFDKYDLSGKMEIHKDQMPLLVGELEGAEPNLSHLKEAIESTLASLTEEDMEELTPGFIDRSGFELLYKLYKRMVVDEVRNNGGYSAAEVAQLRRVFQKYDLDGSGTIELNEMRALITDYFPEATMSKAGQQNMERLLKEIDNGNGELEFKHFLWLMRKCDDKRDADDMASESLVSLDCGIKGDELEGYRQIFNDNVDWHGEIPFDTLVDLFGAFVAHDLTDQKIEELEDLVREVNPYKRSSVRFPQFLRLAKRIMETNIIGIADGANREVRRMEKAKNKYQTFK